jgi:hypothetical protein
MRRRTAKSPIINRLRLLLVVLCLTGLAAVMPGRAKADGEFVQLDWSDNGSLDAVLAMTRVPLNYSATYSKYDSGKTVGLSILRLFPLETGGTVKIGPSFQVSEDDDGDVDALVGVKLGYERFFALENGSLFALAEVNTIETGYFGLLQFGLGQSGVSIEMSYGGSDTYEEATLAVSKRLGTGPVILRGGYKFVSDVAFLGIAINTF